MKIYNKRRILMLTCTSLLASTSTFAQHVIPVRFTIHGAQDIRDFCYPCEFSDVQFDGAKSVASDGETLIIGRTNKIDSNTSPDPNNPYVPGETLIYRRQALGAQPNFQLMARLNDSVEGYPGTSLVETDDQFGWDLTLNGNTLVVGSPYYPNYLDTSDPTSSIATSDPGSYGLEDETGAVFIYTRPDSSSDNWTLQQVIYDPQTVNGERFGHRVMFHENRLLISSARNFRPGYSQPSPFGLSSNQYMIRGLDPMGSGYCQNISSSVNVFTQEQSSDLWTLSQTIELPFMPHEPLYGVPPNGDPVDNTGTCGPDFDDPLGVPPIDSRNGEGYSLERARDFATDDQWLVTVGHPGLFIYQYDQLQETYILIQTIATGVIGPEYNAGSKGFTAVSIDNGVIVVGIKNMMDNTTTNVGGLAIFEFDSQATQEPWSLTYADTIGQGDGVSLYNDTVVMNSNSLWRYLRDSDTLLPIGVVPGAGGFPHPKTARFDDVLLLTDSLSRLLIPTDGPNLVRGVPLCEYDLNSDKTLNFYDINIYSGLYSSGDPRADYVEPFGVLDANDVNHYMALYASGCP